MDIHRAFEILEIQENASLPEIKKAYRDLTQVWHPDRYIGKPRLYEKAQEKMKEINSAYDCIVSFLENKAKSSQDTHTASPSEDKYVFLTCPNCQAKNRVPEEYSTNVRIRCGRCGFSIYGGDSESRETNWSQRTLCCDGDCIGVIKSNGKCSICGKTYSEGKRYSEQKANLRNEEFQKSIRKEKKRKIRRYSFVGLGILAFIALVLVLDRSGNIKPNKTGPSPAPEVAPGTQYGFKPETVPEKLIDLSFLPDQPKKFGSGKPPKTLASKPGPPVSPRLPPIPKQPLPDSGEVVNFTAAERIAPLEIRGTQGSHYLIKLVDANTHAPVLTVFVRSGTTVKIDVPLGTYEVKSASGDTWYGEKHLFGPKTAYSRADKIFEFNVVEDKVHGYTFTLYKVPHGNLNFSTIRADGF